MPVPIICLDEMLHHFAQRFREHLSKPQYQHFVTVLLGLMLCESARTLSGLLRWIANGPSLAGLSRFLSGAPWETGALVERWLRHFREMMQPQVAAEQQRQRQGQAKHRGRPKQPVVTGYVTLDDSTMHKPKGKKMEGLGCIIRPPRTSACLVIAWSRICMYCWDDAVPWLRSCIDSKRSAKRKTFRSAARSN